MRIPAHHKSWHGFGDVFQATVLGKLCDYTSYCFNTSGLTEMSISGTTTAEIMEQGISKHENHSKDS